MENCEDEQEFVMKGEKLTSIIQCRARACPLPLNIQVSLSILFIGIIIGSSGCFRQEVTEIARQAETTTTTTTASTTSSTSGTSSTSTTTTTSTSSTTTTINPPVNETSIDGVSIGLTENQLTTLKGSPIMSLTTPESYNNNQPVKMSAFVSLNVLSFTALIDYNQLSSDYLKVGAVQTSSADFGLTAAGQIGVGSSEAAVVSAYGPADNTRDPAPGGNRGLEYTSGSVYLIFEINKSSNKVKTVTLVRPDWFDLDLIYPVGVVQAL